MRISSRLFGSALALALAAAAQAVPAADANKTGAAQGDAGKVQTPLYTVVDGYKVDPKTMDGFRAWRAAACDRCHGANQQGLVGPSLIESLKVLSPDQFKQTVTDGRLEKGMPSFKTSPTVMEHLEDLYHYLKGRSDGAITRAHVEPMS